MYSFAFWKFRCQSKNKQQISFSKTEIERHKLHSQRNWKNEILVLVSLVEIYFPLGTGPWSAIHDHDINQEKIIISNVMFCTLQDLTGARKFPGDNCILWFPIKHQMWRKRKHFVFVFKNQLILLQIWDRSSGRPSQLISTVRCEQPSEDQVSRCPKLVSQSNLCKHPQDVLDPGQRLGKDY